MELTQSETDYFRMFTSTSAVKVKWLLYRSNPQENKYNTQFLSNKGVRKGSSFRLPKTLTYKITAS